MEKRRPPNQTGRSILFGLSILSRKILRWQNLSWPFIVGRVGLMKNFCVFVFRSCRRCRRRCLNIGALSSIKSWAHLADQAKAANRLPLLSSLSLCPTLLNIQLFPLSSKRARGYESKERKQARRLALAKPLQSNWSLLQTTLKRAFVFNGRISPELCRSVRQFVRPSVRLSVCWPLFMAFDFLI